MKEMVSRENECEAYKTTMKTKLESYVAKMQKLEAENAKLKITSELACLDDLSPRS